MSSSRWLFGTQLGLGSRSGVGGPPNERSDFWGRAKRGVPDAAKPIRYHHAYARFGGGSLLEKTGKNLKLKKQVKIYTNSIKMRSQKAD